MTRKFKKFRFLNAECIQRQATGDIKMEPFMTGHKTCQLRR